MAYDVSGQRALAHVRYLAEEIGERLAGSEGERRAADYIAGQLRSFGVDEVSIEPFPCLRWGCDSLSLSVDGIQTACLPVAHTPATPAGGVEGEFVYLEGGSERDLARVPLQGRIGLLFGGFGDEPTKFRRLMESGLAALILVDTRLPFEWPVAIGIAAHWLHLGPMIPTVSVTYQCAWDLVRAGSRRAQLAMEAWREEGDSQNVVGLLHGSDPSAGEVVLTCHHDTVVDSVGGEDNASGVGCMLELACAFAGRRPRASMRFLACGTEEQLSEGSRDYVLRHRDEMERVRFVVNTDSVGSWAGANTVHVIGDEVLRGRVQAAIDAADFSAGLSDEVSPFSDHFAFAAAGVPGVWFHRTNCAGGRWYHHSKYDTADVLSPAVLEDTLRAQAALLDDAANAPAWPRAIPPAQMATMDRYCQDLYGVKPGFRR